MAVAVVVAGVGAGAGAGAGSLNIAAAGQELPTIAPVADDRARHLQHLKCLAGREATTTTTVAQRFIGSGGGYAGILIEIVCVFGVCCA